MKKLPLIKVIQSAARSGLAASTYYARVFTTTQYIDDSLYQYNSTTGRITVLEDGVYRVIGKDTIYLANAVNNYCATKTTGEKDSVIVFDWWNSTHVLSWGSNVFTNCISTQLIEAGTQVFMQSYVSATTCSFPAGAGATSLAIFRLGGL